MIRGCPMLGDMEMWMRLAANADVGYVRGVDQAYYRRHGQNMSSGLYPSDGLCASVDWPMRRCLTVVARGLPDATRLSDLVHRKLAWEALLAAARAYDRGRTRQTPVDELVAFAFDCWPEASQLPIYRTLQLRKLIGPRVMPYLQPFVLPAAARRKAESWLRTRSRKLRGF